MPGLCPVVKLFPLIKVLFMFVPHGCQRDVVGLDSGHNIEF